VRGAISDDRPYRDQRLDKLASQLLGKRLTYAELTGKDADAARPF
jgi:hypothetical protein